MVEQDDRTHSGRRATKLSAAKIPPMDREDQWAFAKWVPRFREKIRTDERMAAWDALAKKRCLPGDLEWAFYWAIDSMETASYVPAKFRLLRNTGLGGKQMRRCPRGNEGIFHGFHSGRRSESGDVVSG